VDFRQHAHFDVEVANGLQVAAVDARVAGQDAVTDRGLLDLLEQRRDGFGVGRVLACSVAGELLDAARLKF
jgi:hypothetical protein